MIGTLDESKRSADGRLPPRVLMLSPAIDLDDPILEVSSSWAAALAARARGVDVIAMRRGRSRPVPGLRIQTLGKERGFSEPRRAARFYRLLAGLLREESYDVCFAHMAPVFASMAWPMLRPLGVPIVMWYAHRDVGRQLRLAERLVDRVVTCSRQSCRLTSDKVRVVGHGIDTARFSPGDAERHDEFTIAIVGRLSPVKRIELAFDALRSLAEANRARFSVRIVGPVGGPPEYQRELEAKAGHPALRDRVAFVGPRTGPALVEEYRSADLLLNTSDTGALDKAVLEAMSCGCLVVTTNASYRAVLWDEADALVPQGEPAAIAEACLRIYGQSPETRRARGMQLRSAVVDHHSLDHLMDALTGDVFPSVMRGSRSERHEGL